MPLSKILDNLASLPKISAEEMAPLNPAYLNNGKKLGVTDYKKIRNAELARKLLKEMMKTKCPGELPVKKKRKDKFVVGLGELVLDPLPVDEYGIEEKWDPEMKAWVNSKGEYRFESGLVVSAGKLELEPEFVVGLGELELDPVSEVGLGELEMWDDDMQAWINTKGEVIRHEDGFKDKVIKDVHDALEEVNQAQKDKVEVGLGDLELWDDDMQAWITPKTGDVRYEDGFKDKLVQDVRNALETSGLQTTIVNGLQGINAMENSSNRLFE
jgi:succinate dehydrogenase flavin-adding protein (antitoxin of CptAB toxin-antitoxin module)